MFFEGPTIGVNGFSMVFKILRAMVNNGFDNSMTEATSMGVTGGHLGR